MAIQYSLAMRLLNAGSSCHPLEALRQRWWRGWQLFLFLLFIVAIAGPVRDARATSGYVVHPGGLELVLPVAKRGNQILSVSTNTQQRVRLVVESPMSTTEYSTTGRVSDRRVAATFGSLGRLDVRLHFVRRASDPPHYGRCRGRGTLYQEGTYRGVLHFSQATGIPAVSRTHGPVYFERRFRQTCRGERQQSESGGATGTKHKLEVGFLKADSKNSDHTVLIEAFGFSLRRHLVRPVGQFTATIYETEHGVRISRQITVPVHNDSFIMSKLGNTPETFEVRPPAPFAGRALYSRSPGALSSWSGDLTVDISSTERIPLTGPGFIAVFCRGFTLATLKRCSKVANTPLP